MTNKKILIIGGFGFIGSWLYNYLHYVNDVRIVDREMSSFYSRKDDGSQHIYDYRRKNLLSNRVVVYMGMEKYLEEKGEWMPDIIIHLAATPLEAGLNSPLARRQLVDDVDITYQVVSHARQTNARLLFMSSVFAYGDYLYATPEDRQLEPKTPYGISKATGEYLIKNNVMKWNIIRSTSIYGYGDKNKRATGIILEKAMKGEKVKINKSAWLDFIYIRDLVEGIIAVLDKDENGVYNISGGKAITLLDYLKVMEEVLEKTIEYDLVENADRPMRGTMSNDKARIELGWEPRYNLKSGLIDYIEFINKYGYQVC